MSALAYPDLKGKLVLVTGSSKALGAETARQFVPLWSQSRGERPRSTSDRASHGSIQFEGGECLGVAADVTSAAELGRMQATIRDRFGDVSILAAFAGGLGNPVPVLDISEEQWRRTVEADLNSKFLTVKTFAPAMNAQGQGNIILMSSASGRLVSQASAAYGPAEAGTLMLMRHLAQELGPFGIRANAIAPSIVWHERIEKFMPDEAQAKAAEMLPLPRIGMPEDVAQAVLFLASEASSWITGHALDVNGGKLMI